MNETKTARIKIIISMLIFGTIGLFTKPIGLPSSLLAAARGFIGVAFLLLVMCLRGEKLRGEELKRNGLWLISSGAAIGFNWIFLFESYKYTGIPTATLCYYLAPAIVVFLSPLLLRERISAVRICAAVAALLGMVLVSGVLTGSSGNTRGIAFGVAAAVLYASVMMMNKKITDISDFGKTVAQLFVAAVVVLPYALLTEDIGALTVDADDIVLTLVVGVIHTGLAYALYFGAMRSLPAQTTAVLSYIDPASAVLLSAAAAALLPSLFGDGALTVYTAVGALLIIGSSLFAELVESRKK